MAEVSDNARNLANWKFHQLQDAGWIMSLIKVDMDQDGLDDVVAIDKESVVWDRREKTGWSEHVILLPKGVGGGKSTAVFDVNQDGKNDVVFSCEGAAGPLSGTRWLSWKGTPFDREWQSHEIAGEPGLKYDRVVPCDVDGDGDLDILCCEERDQLGVFWYENPFG